MRLLFQPHAQLLQRTSFRAHKGPATGQAADAFAGLRLLLKDLLLQEDGKASLARANL